MQKAVADDPGSAEELESIEQIVKQARGIFLWFKLVLIDLLKNAARMAISVYGFGHLVLEDRYRIMRDNGYSMLMKYAIFKRKLVHNGIPQVCSPVTTVSSQVVHHTRKAGSTTGKSAPAFFKDMIWETSAENNFSP